jgi:hypothetical protein
MPHTIGLIFRFPPSADRSETGNHIGLRLELRGVPLEVLVIDSVQKPTLN